MKIWKQLSDANKTTAKLCFASVALMSVASAYSLSRTANLEPRTAEVIALPDSWRTSLPVSADFDIIPAAVGNTLQALFIETSTAAPLQQAVLPEIAPAPEKPAGKALSASDVRMLRTLTQAPEKEGAFSIELGDTRQLLGGPVKGTGHSAFSGPKALLR